MNEKNPEHINKAESRYEAEGVIWLNRPPLDPENAECLDTRVFEVRQELSEIPPLANDTDNPVELEGNPHITSGTFLGSLQEKQMKRRQKELKETSPRQFSEMLVVANDFQFLRNADDEAVGAFMSFMEANKARITHLVLNGDVADMEQANKFGSSPDQAGTMADEIATMRWFFGQMDRLLPNAKKVMIMGNHSARYSNYFANQTNGIEEWIKTPQEAWGIGEDWQVVPYGQGKYYQWHDRIFWHGQRSGAKSHIAKLELQDAGVSVTTAHINKNQYHEERDALGNLKTAYTHGGFSKDNLHFVKKANSNWSQGFGIYYWDKKVGEQPYMVILKHGNPRFIDPSGVIHDGTNYNLRREIGLDPKPRRSR